MRTKSTIVVVLSILVLASATAFVIVPGVRFSRVRQQYAIGTSFQDALQRVAPPILVQTSAITFPDGPTEEQKRTYPHHSILLEHQGAVLLFDHYDRLMRVQPLSSPWHLLQWRMERE